MAIETNEEFGRTRNSQSESQMINSETMENKDPAINQHQDDSSNNVDHSYSNQGLQDEDAFEGENQEDDDVKDPFFQKNAEIAQDLDDDLESKDSISTDNRNSNSRESDDSEESDIDFDRKDKADLGTRNVDQEYDRNYADPYLEEEDSNPNIKEQDPLN